MSTDTTTPVRWFGTTATTRWSGIADVAAEASETTGPFLNLHSLSDADEAEARRAGQFAGAVQRASRLIAGIGNDTTAIETGNQGGSNG